MNVRKTWLKNFADRPGKLIQWRDRRPGVHPFGQRLGVYREGAPGVARRGEDQDDLHRTGESVAERLARARRIRRRPLGDEACRGRPSGGRVLAVLKHRAQDPLFKESRTIPGRILHVAESAAICAGRFLALFVHGRKRGPGDGRTQVNKRVLAPVSFPFAPASTMQAPV